MDSMSFASILARVAPGTPSITTSGAVLAPKVERPLILIVGLSLGLPPGL